VIVAVEQPWQQEAALEVEGGGSTPVKPASHGAYLLPLHGDVERTAEAAAGIEDKGLAEDVAVVPGRRRHGVSLASARDPGRSSPPMA
jgi:hypothetical protein